MIALALHLTLALVWCMLTASMHPWNFIAGLIVGGVVVAAYSRVAGRDPYFGRIFRILRFGAYFARILMIANLQIAREVVTPGFSQQPRIVRYPVGHLTDVQKTTLANAITLTPGTLVVDISPDGQYLYLHCMYARNRDRQIAQIDELAMRLKREVFE